MDAVICLDLLGEVGRESSRFKLSRLFDLQLLEGLLGLLSRRRTDCPQYRAKLDKTGELFAMELKEKIINNREGRNFARILTAR